MFETGILGRQRDRLGVTANVQNLFHFLRAHVRVRGPLGKYALKQTNQYRQLASFQKKRQRIEPSSLEFLRICQLTILKHVRRRLHSPTFQSIIDQLCYLQLTIFGTLFLAISLCCFKNHRNRRLVLLRHLRNVAGTDCDRLTTAAFRSFCKKEI
jgi:hypothetical protein